jgi:competence protein ComEC
MKKQGSVFVILGVLVLANVFAWTVVFDLRQSKFLEVNFFDVGQGDAIFIETPERHQILIDGGPDSTILEKLGQAMPFWDRTIDLVILTHPEEDHLSGLIGVLKRYKVENILWTGVLHEAPEYDEWERLIENEGAKIQIAKAGQKIFWSKNHENFIEILYPFENLAGQDFKDVNDTSVVSRLVFGEKSFLFPGDIFEKAEGEILNRGATIDSDVLKVAHHGSKTSSSPQFLAEVSPEIAVISLSKDNKYGHPHQETLEKLKNYGIRILRTDQDGDIKIISDGINLKLE